MAISPARWIFVSAVLGVACSAGEGNASVCGARSDSAIVERHDAIYGGGEHAPYLAMSARQESAVVRVEAEIPESVAPGECSGVLMPGGVVITAKHCVTGLSAPALRVLGGPDATIAEHADAVVSIEPHPELDVAALRLASGELAFSGVDALGPPSAKEDDWSGRRVVAAGYGWNEVDSRATRLFAVEEVTRADSNFVTIHGRGASGACMGDSGGPLLVRDGTGRLAALGVLSSGSPSCVGEDHFVRLDALTEWLAKVGVRSASDQGCGELSFEGRCFDGLPVWCEAGRLFTEPCTGGQTCGWNAEVGGYRCVDPASACTGADRFGTCSNGRVRFCDADRSERRACSECERCGVDSRTGVAECTAS